MGIPVHVGGVGTWSALAFATVLTACAIAGKAACALGSAAAPIALRSRSG
jgi:hypothetical protein